ncbi:MAG: hypothetical protein ACRCZE_05025 [Candidatus Altimarinota bacterium]
MHLNDLEKSISVSSTLIQALAIFIGGLWAYNKFDWSKRAESAIKIKAVLMEYQQMHNEAAMQFRADQRNGKEDMECWMNYAMKMIPPRNTCASKIHLSCYLPKKLRKRIFDVVFLSLNKGRGPQNEDIDKNWNDFGKEMDRIKEDLDNLVSK